MLFPLAADPGVIAVMIPLLGVVAGIVAIVTSHIRSMEQIRLKAKGQASESVQAELQAMRQEIAALRDTTTKFDISFDAALGSLETRMERVEQRQMVQGYTATDQGETQNVAGR